MVLESLFGPSSLTTVSGTGSHTHTHTHPHTHSHTHTLTHTHTPTHTHTHPNTHTHTMHTFIEIHPKERLQYHFLVLAMYLYYFFQNIFISSRFRKALQYKNHAVSGGVFQ